MGKFYVYVLCRPDGSPFYVGKGSRRRINDHEPEARRGCDCRKCRTIRKIWQQGGKVQRSIVFTTDDEPEAYTRECELIAEYGRETLCNLTDGGDGFVGLSPESRAQRAQRMSEVWQDPAIRTRWSAGLRQAFQRPEVQQKKQEYSRAYWAKPESRAQASIRTKLHMSTDESRARVGTQVKERWADPDYKARVSAAVSAGHAREKPPEKQAEEKARRSAASKAMWADPEYRAKHAAALRKKKEGD